MTLFTRVKTDYFELLKFSFVSSSLQSFHIHIGICTVSVSPFRYAGIAVAQLPGDGLHYLDSYSVFYSARVLCKDNHGNCLLWWTGSPPVGRVARGSDRYRVHHQHRKSVEAKEQGEQHSRNRPEESDVHRGGRLAHTEYRSSLQDKVGNCIGQDLFHQTRLMPVDKMLSTSCRKKKFPGLGWWVLNFAKIYKIKASREPATRE